MLKRLNKDILGRKFGHILGYLFDKDIVDNMSKKYDFTKELLKNIDYIVDGEFKEEYKNPTLRFKGSSNQRIIDVQKSLESRKSCIVGRGAN